MLQISALSPALVCQGLAGSQRLVAISLLPADSRSLALVHPGRVWLCPGQLKVGLISEQAGFVPE